MENELLADMFRSLPKRGKFSGMNYEKFMALVEKNTEQISEVVFDFAKKEYVGKKVAKDSIKFLTSGKFSETFDSYPLFLVADALGCDDLGYRRENEELNFIYSTIWTYWATCIKYANKQG